MKYLVSACLLGCQCKYSGESNCNEKVVAFSKSHQVVPVCPEQLGGLPTPRIPAERVGSKIINQEGLDVTNGYQKGAEETLKLAKLLGCDRAILKKKSPSCGKDIIYDGTFTHTEIPGNGVTAQLLMENGVAVFTEDEIDDL